MRATVALAVVVLAVASISAQTPTRDPARVVFFGSAIVRGIVVTDDETRAPLRNAFVTLERIGVEDIRSTPTDDQGRFAFDRLPPGSYALNAGKGGYISISYGAPKSGMTGSVVVLSDGQVFEAKPMALMRGGVIAGRLFDHRGLPVSDTAVIANRFALIDGERRRRITQGSEQRGRTNAHGEYRIHGLLPGEYLVYAGTSGYVAAEVTAGELRWADQAIGAAPLPGRPFSYAPAMFPGTADAAAAVPIVLGRGEERLDVNFGLQYVPVARAAGVVTGVDGRPAPNTIIRAAPKQPNPFTTSTINSGRTGPDGGFVFVGLPPGEHRFTAQGGQVATQINEGVRRVNTTQWGRADVSLAGQDVSDIAIRLQAGGSVSGSLVFRGAATTPRPDLTRVMVQMGGSTYVANPDGTFKIEAVPPDQARFDVTVPPPAGSTASPWFARSAMYDGEDLLDHRLEVVPGGGIAGVVVTLSDVQTHLSGTLTDSEDRPAPDFYVLLFSTDKAHWTTGARRTRFVRANDAASYAITGLPPGDYYLCALTEIDMELRFEPTYLEQLVPAAIKITLGEGEKKTQNLRVAK